jgi:hypothetical protein
MGAAHSNALQRDAKYRGSKREQEMINMVSLYVVMFVVDDVVDVGAVLENGCCTVASMLLYTEDSHQGSVALFDDDVIVVDVVGLRGRMNGVLCCFGSIVVS